MFQTRPMSWKTKNWMRSFQGLSPVSAVMLNAGAKRRSSGG